jgi:hypothetical protein
MSTKYVTPGQVQSIADLPVGAAYLEHQAFVVTADAGTGTIGSTGFVGIRVFESSTAKLATLNNPITTPGNLRAVHLIADNSSDTLTVTGNSIYQNAGSASDPQISFGGGATSFLNGDTGWTLITSTKNPLWQWDNSQSSVYQNSWLISPDIGSGFTLVVATQGSGVAGAPFYIRAGSAAGGNNSGGPVIIEGGNLSGSPAVRGPVSLCVYHVSVAGDTPLIEAAEVAAGRLVASLAKQSAVTSTNVPSGDGVVFIGDCDTAPTSSPVGGGDVYEVTGVGLIHYGTSGTITTLGPV